VTILASVREQFGRYADKVERRASRYGFVKPATMRNSQPMVSFTFDDVPETAYATGAAMLERHRARGTFYVSGALAGTVQPDWRLMSADDCRDLHQRGHEIGCHTHSHRAAQALDAAEMEAEIVRNRVFFRSIATDLGPENFAYPYGSVSLARKRQVQRHFASCRGVTGGINAGRVDLALLKAVPLSDARTDRRAVEALIRATVARNGWLIFFTHDVTASPTPFGCTPGLLEHALAAAGSAGCATLTVRDALRHLG
jgi:peptidoglycan/xylan/chitin deacetylase (PgdA/CDA1 family)